MWDGYILPSLGDTNAELPYVVQESTIFIAVCYGFPQCENMTTARQKMCKKRVGKSLKSVVKVSTLPPTAESFVENVKRAHLQACIWKNALDADPPDLSPETYGWLRNEVSQTLVPVTVPKGVALAPDDVLKLIECGCENDDPCSSMRLIRLINQVNKNFKSLSLENKGTWLLMQEDIITLEHLAGYIDTCFSIRRISHSS